MMSELFKHGDTPTLKKKKKKPHKYVIPARIRPRQIHSRRALDIYIYICVRV